MDKKKKNLVKAIIPPKDEKYHVHVEKKMPAFLRKAMKAKKKG